MKGTVAELLTFLGRSHEFTEAVVQTAGDARRRAERLAQTLSALWPSPLSACLLQEGDGLEVRVLDGASRTRPEWEALLRKELSHWADQGPPGELATASLPQALELPGQLLGVAPLAWGDRRYGCLALALPRGARSQGAALASLLLARQVEHLGLFLHLESQPGEGLTGPDAESCAWLNDFADLAYLIAHEFNNFLNNLLLHVSIVELKTGGGPAVSDLAAIRHLGMEFAAKVQQFQQLSRQHRPQPVPVDLNTAVRAAVADAGPIPVHTELAADLPAVLGTAADLKRLTELLLQDAAAALAGATGAITVRTGQEANRVQLRVADTGPPVTHEQLGLLLEPFAVVRPGSDGLRLAVCRAVTRRLQGNIQTEQRPGGGLTVTVELRAAVP